MLRLLLATRNLHKTREFAELLGPEFSLRDLMHERLAPEIEETGSTFQENACIKALALSRVLPEEIIIADDSGLQVDVLSGAPGVFSARYAGEHATDEQNVAKLLREWERANAASSAARFVCAIAAAKSGEIIFLAEGESLGTIVSAPRGENGFGYDPIFIPAGFEQTFAELSAEAKNEISHRAAAARKLCAFLKTARL